MSDQPRNIQRELIPSVNVPNPKASVHGINIRVKCTTCHTESAVRVDRLAVVQDGKPFENSCRSCGGKRTPHSFVEVIADAPALPTVHHGKAPAKPDQRSADQGASLLG